jgi:hypothetical protein
MPFKISELTPSLSITANDLIQIIDVDDGTMGASGTNRSVTAGVAANEIADLITSVPSIVATALSTKADINGPTFLGTVTLPTTTSIGPVNSAEIGRLSGVTSNIQTQLNSKLSTSSPSFSNTAVFSNSSANSLTVGALHCNATGGAILIDDGGHKRISWNDGDGNLNIRSGHYRTSTATVFAKAPGDSNGGAARITMNTDTADGTITISTAAVGTPGTAVTWANNFVLTKDAAYTDKKFGIGTSTPDAALTVIASTTDNNPASNGIRVVNFGNNSDDNAYLAVHTTSATGGDPVVSWDINGVAGWSAGIDNSDSDKFKISSNWNDLANNTRVTIQHSDGFIGIGKSNPATALDVNGTVTATSFSGSFNGSITGNSATSTLAGKASTLASGGADGSGMTFNWVGKGGTPAWLWGGDGIANMYVYTPGNLSVGYATSAGTAGTATTAGSATTAGTASSAFYASRAAEGPVNGTFTQNHTANVSKIFVGGFGTNKAYGIHCQRAANENAAALHFTKENGTKVGSIVLDTANSTNYNTTSDYRLKEDYKPIVNPLETIRSLNPINFKWIDNDSRIDGFIAHEVQEVVYNAVTGDKDEVDSDGNPVYQQMDVSKLIPLLTAALQEQQKMIDSLVKEVNDLKNVVR